MRGALTIEQAFAMSIDDRVILARIVTKNIEELQKAGVPAY